jgi:hypothetical protein
VSTGRALDDLMRITKNSCRAIGRNRPLPPPADHRLLEES